VEERPADGRYEVGVEFINLKPDDKEKIIAIIFRQNREKIREMRRETT
jgi:c-di-GMP-binding flagellar brake protein YcgR